MYFVQECVISYLMLKFTVHGYGIHALATGNVHFGWHSFLVQITSPVNMQRLQTETLSTIKWGTNIQKGKFYWHTLTICYIRQLKGRSHLAGKFVHCIHTLYRTQGNTLPHIKGCVVTLWFNRVFILLMPTSHNYHWDTLHSTLLQGSLLPGSPQQDMSQPVKGTNSEILVI